MSNRTNQTLSAQTNRLNLGSRTLAIAACGNGIGTTSLRSRLARLSHPGVFARVERMRSEPSIRMPAYQPAMPDAKRGMCDPDGSKSPSLGSSWPSRLSPSGRSTRDDRTQGRVVAEAPPVLRPVVVIDVPAGRPMPQPSQPSPHAPSRPSASARAFSSACFTARASDILASAAAS